ncbi:MAG: hypothetical protein ABFD83_01765 [Armatimonadota bacterium]
MALVLDSSIPLAVALENAKVVASFEKAICSNTCYITDQSVAEFACLAMEKCGAGLTEKWIGWLYTLDNVKMVSGVDEEFAKQSAEAYVLGGISIASASAVALAHKMAIPILTCRPGFSLVATYCDVMLIGV